MLEAELTPEP